MSIGQPKRRLDGRINGALVVLVAGLLALLCVASATAGPAAAPAPAYKLVGKWGKIGTTGNSVFASTTRGIAVDKAGNVYVADTDNNRVQVFTAKGGFLRKWGSIGGGNGQFAGAEDIDIAADGTVWVADRGNGRLQLFTSSGGFTTAVDTPSGESPQGVALEANGTMVAAVEGGETSGFRRYTKSASGWGAAGPLLASLPGFRADDIEVSPDGSFYLVRAATQTSDDRLQRVSPSGQVKTIVKLKSGDGTRGIAVDLDCNIWAADTPGRQIAKYSPSGKRLATAIAPDLIANDMAVGPKGDLYVIQQNVGILRFAENRSKPAAANIPGALTASGGRVKVPFTLSGVACPAEVAATATLSGKGITGTASGLKLKAGAKNTIDLKLTKAASGPATFTIVLKTNGRPTTQTRAVTLSVR